MEHTFDGIEKFNKALLQNIYTRLFILRKVEFFTYFTGNCSVAYPVGPTGKIW